MFALPGISSVHAATLAVGQPAPALTIETLDGKTFDITAQKGKIVLLHFWATWCAPCQQEMSVMNSFYKKHRNEGFEIIALDIEAPRGQTRDQMKQMLSKVDYSGALLRDASVNEYETPQAIPSTYVIDRAGIIRDVQEPDVIPLTEKDLDQLIEPLLR